MSPQMCIYIFTINLGNLCFLALRAGKLTDFVIHMVLLVELGFFINKRRENIREISISETITLVS